MKAIVCEKYGPPEVLQIREREKPVPADNEVVIKARAASVTKYDCWQRSATAPPGFSLLSRATNGFLKPRQPVLGTELSGEVESFGKDVKRFEQGDPVYAYNGMKQGAYAEYVCLPEESVAPRPENISHEEAGAALQGPLTALYFIRKGQIGSGQKILVFGASGGVGSAAVQIARHFGAEVTGVCSTSKTDFVKSLGAAKVIDYKKEDFTRSGEKYDIILDTIGKTPVSGCKKSLKKNGYYLLTTFGLPKAFQLIWFALTSGRKLFIGALQEKTEDMVFLKGLIETGELKIFIDKVFPMEQAAEAHRYAEAGEKKGSIIISMEN